MAEPEKATPHHRHEAFAPLHRRTMTPSPASPAADKNGNSFGVADVVLRFLLFASALVAVLIMVTSKQTKTFSITLPILPTPVTVTRQAKFNLLPALIYFVAALSVAGLYSIITTILSFFALSKRYMPTKLLSHFIILDVLLLGIVASATGTAGAVGYLGLKGNSHTSWMKICNRFDQFCKHVATSVIFSVFASVLLVMLVLLNTYALSNKIPK